MNHASRMVALACLAFCCFGCAPRPCKTAAAAFVAADLACVAAGVAVSDPALLVACGGAYARVAKALEEGQCAAELKP